MELALCTPENYFTSLLNCLIGDNIFAFCSKFKCFLNLFKDLYIGLPVFMRNRILLVIAFELAPCFPVGNESHGLILPN